MVAAAGDEGAISPRTAWGFLAGTFAVLCLVVALAPKASDLGLAPPPKSADALADSARELIRQFGYTDQPADSDSSFSRAYDFLRYRALHEPSPQRVRELAKAATGAHELLVSPEPASHGPAGPREPRCAK